MSLFVLGFVLTSSGWGPLLALGSQNRPDYSVCGQEMCSCLPFTPSDSDCPLCISNDDETKSCSDEQSETPKRLPSTKRFDSISDASQAGCACVFLSLVLGHRVRQFTFVDPSQRARIDQDRVPLDPLRETPAPPPRA